MSVRPPAAPAWIIVSLLVSSACLGGPGQTAEQTGLATPHPLSVQPALDSAKIATQDTPVEGGTLSVTGSDGTVFTLTIPNGALAGPEKITMTPVKSISGLPFSGGLQAAVELGPEGLQLFKPATLVIKPAKNVPFSSQVGFAYHGSGQELFMYPLAPKVQLTIMVVHFSGVGSASATAADVQRQVQNQPTSPEDQAAQLISAAIQDRLAQERQSQQNGNPPSEDLPKQIVEYEQQFFDRVVKPTVEHALSDASLIDGAMQTTLGWMRQVQLLGADGDPRMKADFDYLGKQMRQLLDNAAKDAADRCFQKQDPTAFVKIMWVERVRQLMGMGETPEVSDTAQKCMTFKLDFFTNDPFFYDAYPHSAQFGLKGMVIHAKSHTPVSKDLTLTYFGPYDEGPSPWTYTNVHMTKPLTVYSLDFDVHYEYDPTRPNNPKPTISDIVLQMDPGDGEATFVQGGLPDDNPTQFMSGSDGTGFPMWHADEVRGDGYEIKNWGIAGQAGSWTASKAYKREIVIAGADMQMAEDTSFKLTFAPGA